MTSNKKPSQLNEKNSTSENIKKTDRHNDNAREAASLEPEAPRISTDHL